MLGIHEKQKNPELLHLLETLKHHDSPVLRALYIYLSGATTPTLLQLDAELDRLKLVDKHRYYRLNVFPTRPWQTIACALIPTRDFINSESTGWVNRSLNHTMLSKPTLSFDRKLELSLTPDDRETLRKVLQALYDKYSIFLNKVVSQDDQLLQHLHGIFRNISLLFEDVEVNSRMLYPEANLTALGQIEKKWPNGSGQSTMQAQARNRMVTGITLGLLDEPSLLRKAERRPLSEAEIKKKFSLVALTIEHGSLEIARAIFERWVSLNPNLLVFTCLKNTASVQNHIHSQEFTVLTPELLKTMEIQEDEDGCSITMDGKTVLLFYNEYRRRNQRYLLSTTGINLKSKNFDGTKYRVEHPRGRSLPAGIGSLVDWARLLHSPGTIDSLPNLASIDLGRVEELTRFELAQVLFNELLKVGRTEQPIGSAEPHTEYHDQISLIKHLASKPEACVLPIDADSIGPLPEKIKPSWFQNQLAFIAGMQILHGRFDVRLLGKGTRESSPISNLSRFEPNVLFSILKRFTHELDLEYSSKNTKFKVFLNMVIQAVRSPSFVITARMGSEMLTKVNGLFAHDLHTKCTFAPYTLPIPSAEDELITIQGKREQNATVDHNRRVVKLWLPMDCQLHSVIIQSPEKKPLAYPTDFTLEKSHPFNYYQAIITPQGMDALEHVTDGLFVRTQVSLPENATTKNVYFTVDQVDRLTIYIQALADSGYTKLAARMTALVERYQRQHTPITTLDLARTINDATYSFDNPPPSERVMSALLPALPSPSKDGEFWGQCAQSSVLFSSLLNFVYENNDSYHFSDATMLTTISAGFGIRLVGIPHSIVRGTDQTSTVHHDPTPRQKIATLLSLFRSDQAKKEPTSETALEKMRKLLLNRERQKKRREDPKKAEYENLEPHIPEIVTLANELTEILSRFDQTVKALEESETASTPIKKLKKDPPPITLVSTGQLVASVLKEIELGKTEFSAQKIIELLEKEKELWDDWDLATTALDTMLSSRPAKAEALRKAIKRLYGPYIGLAPAMKSLLHSFKVALNTYLQREHEAEWNARYLTQS